MFFFRFWTVIFYIFGRFVKRKCRTFLRMALHPRQRKKTIEANIAKNSSAKILAKTFDFDPQEYLDKFLLFDLKKTSEEQIFEAI